MIKHLKYTLSWHCLESSKQGPLTISLEVYSLLQDTDITLSRHIRLLHRLFICDKTQLLTSKYRRYDAKSHQCLLPGLSNKERASATLNSYNLKNCILQDCSISVTLVVLTIIYEQNIQSTSSKLIQQMSSYQECELINYCWYCLIITCKGSCVRLRGTTLISTRPSLH